jgi:poly-gamma-glutamate synthesis protein (capsule biosynthesis protein)
MNLKTIIVLLLAIAVQPLAAQNADSVVTLLFAGDIMGHDAQIAAAYNESTKTYDYTDCFSYIKPYVEKADFALANFEVTLAGPPFKGYPQFSSPDALAVAVKDCGFDALVTANNHTCDGGKVGVVRTLDVLDSLQIPHTGTFHDSAEFKQKYPLMVDVKGIKLAILNYTYGTNELPTPKGTVVNRIDKNNIIRDISAAKRLNPDLIVACMHWGIEYDSMPSRNQIQMADLLKKQGVDLIIGSHPHVLQPMELDTAANQLLIYSLGNFVSAQRTAPRDGTAVVNVILTKRNGQKPKIEANYQLTYVHYPKVGDKRLFYIVPVADVEAGLIEPIQSDNWGRLKQFATEAREVLGRNKNVPEMK